MTDSITVYSDYVCPFCYLGKASLEEYLVGCDDPPDVEWHQFDLRGSKRGPDGEIRDGVDDVKDEDYFEQARENVLRLREEYGVEMFDPADQPDGVDSWDAQKLALYVQRECEGELFDALNDALFDAVWQDGRDVGGVDVLVDVAAEAGVAEDEVRRVVADDELDRSLRDRFATANEIGVTGVPTFVYGERAARGAVPPEQFERLVEGA